MSYGTRANIRLDALRANFDLLKSRVPGCRVMAAVKANAYGHGIITVSRALADADAFAVARLVEVAALRDAGIDNDIVLMGGVTTPDELKRAAELQCDIVVHTGHQVSLLESAKVPPLKTWLKIDTGMHRLGLLMSEVTDAVARLRAAPTVRDLGLMTHLANADHTEDRMTILQLDRFFEFAQAFDGDVSVANSAALLGWTNAIQSDRWQAQGSTWIRPGISLFGISPLAGVSAATLGLEPVMNFDTTLLAVKPLKAGEPVGYGGTWRAPSDTFLGIAAAGYGDGYSRFIPSGTPVLVNERRVPLAGVISMDLMAVDLGAQAGDAVGAPVRLWGQDLPVEEIAMHAGTTAYPLVTGVRDRARNLG